LASLARKIFVAKFINRFVGHYHEPPPGGNKTPSTLRFRRMLNGAFDDFAMVKFHDHWLGCKIESEVRFIWVGRTVRLPAQTIYPIKVRGEAQTDGSGLDR